jgi:hypothetical protein
VIFIDTENMFRGERIYKIAENSRPEEILEEQEKRTNPLCIEE